MAGSTGHLHISRDMPDLYLISKVRQDRRTWSLSQCQGVKPLDRWVLEDVNQGKKETHRAIYLRVFSITSESTAKHQSPQSTCLLAVYLLTRRRQPWKACYFRPRPTLSYTADSGYISPVRPERAIPAFITSRASTGRVPEHPKPAREDASKQC